MAKKEPSKIVAYWLSEIKSSREREKRYRELGKEVVTIYEAEEEKETPFNILYSNTETLRPALYSAQPRAVVQRRFKDDDPIGKNAAEANRRMLDYHLDTNKEDYETLNEAMGSCVLDALLPGCGRVQLKYDANFIPIDEPRPPDEHDDDPVDDKARAEYAEKEQVCYESVIWDRFHTGYAKKWTKVPWIAYEYHLTKEEVATLLGKKLAQQLKYQAKEQSEDDNKKSRTDEETGDRKTACIYQIWDKAGGKKVRYISPNYPDGELRVDDDPLGLTGFFNTPRPLMFVEKTTSLVPTAPYAMYKRQHKQLNRIAGRIERITEAIRARGIYDGSMGGDLEKLMQKDDNALVPAEVSSALATEKGFQNAIWFLPLDVLIAVLQQLYQAQETCKQTIYEITGIADIMRGATNASETLGAQQIKNQWGTLRLKRMQAEVQRYVRDLLRMTTEIAADKFDEETWAKMTGLPFVTTQQRQQLEQQAMNMPPVVPGQPPTPEQQKLQAELQKPVWGEVLQLLKDDEMRAFRIDIETNSTIQPEAAEDQEALTKLLTAFGQTMQAIGPLVIQGVLPFKAAQGLMLTITRRFRFGDDIEDDILAMQPPKPPEEDKSKEMEAQQKELEMQGKAQQMEVEHATKKGQMQLEEEKMRNEMDLLKREMELMKREMQLDMQEQRHGMQQDLDKQTMEVQKGRANEEIEAKNKEYDMKTKTFNVQKAVDSRTDAAAQSMNKALQPMLQQMQTMQQRQDEMGEVLQQLLKASTAKRVKKAIRGKDNRIEAVEESIAM